jgi:hypothetical protein
MAPKGAVLWSVVNFIWIGYSSSELELIQARSIFSTRKYRAIRIRSHDFSGPKSRNAPKQNMVPTFLPFVLILFLLNVTNK